MRLAGILLLAVCTGFACGAETDAPRPTVGMTGKLEGVVLPGSELEPKPLTDRLQPVVVQWMSAAQQSDGSFRYDIGYHTLEPGTFDLRNYLRRKDGTPTSDLPPIPVTITPIRPPGHADINSVTLAQTPKVGGYRTRMIALSVVWIVGFVVIVASFFFLRRKKVAVEEVSSTLADRLRPLVERAAMGQLPSPELAELERALFALWRGRLDLNYVDPTTAMNSLRAHSEAGPLLMKLEEWLHNPGEDKSVDVASLLAPYRNLPPDAADFGKEVAA